MGQAPIKCPMRGENEKWRLIDTYQKDFSFGKALVGAALIGKVGVLAGFLYVNNQILQCNLAPYIENGRTMVPNNILQVRD